MRGSRKKISIAVVRLLYDLFSIEPIQSYSSEKLLHTLASVICFEDKNLSHVIVLHQNAIFLEITYQF
jgi:hypothetical protein